MSETPFNADQPPSIEPAPARIEPGDESALAPSPAGCAPSGQGGPIVDAARGDGDPPLQAWMCGARTKGRSGQPCRGRAMANGRCRIHGGATPVGLASANLKHGRYSKSLAASLPARLRERFEAAFNDPQLLSLRKYVALYDIKTTEAAEKLEALDTGDYRGRLLALWEEFTRANAEKIDPDGPHAAEARAAKASKITASLSAIGQVIRDGAAEEDAWREVFSSVKERMAVTALEHRRLVDLEQILTVEQAAALVVVLHRAVERVVSDPKVRQQIAAEIDREAGFANRTIRLPPPAVGH